MFWDKFMALCKSRGISPAQFARDVKISNGILTKWKSGSLPGTEALLKISQYFDVTIDYLLNDEEVQEYNKKFYYNRNSKSVGTKPENDGSYYHYTISLNSDDIDNFTYEYSYDNESSEARRIRESIINTINEMNEENLKKTESIIKIMNH